jgi:hypothetical protein
METTKSDKAIDALYDEFRDTYGFISISRRDVAEYYRHMNGVARVDLLLDYILANGMEEDIVL